MKKLISLGEKIFIAGANGMAGNAICRSFLKKGYGNKNLGGYLLTPSRKDLNLLNKSEVESWFIKNSPTIVVIAAAKVGGILSNNSFPADFILENLKIQTNIIEAAWSNRVKRLLFLGSSCIYPKYALQPITEEELLNGNLEETNQFYAIAKISGMKLCEALRIQHNFDAISLMPTNLYGPKDNYHSTNSHVMAALIRKFSIAVADSKDTVTCWGTGSPLREFLHADDLGDAVTFALENWDPKSHKSPRDKNNKPLYYLNVGTGLDISIKDLSTKIANATGFKGKIIWDASKPDGTPRKKMDISRFNNLGWNAKISLNEGIKKSIESFRKEHLNS